MEDFNVYDNREEEEKNSFSKPNEQDMDGDVQEAEFEEVLEAAKQAHVDVIDMDTNAQEEDMKQDDITVQEIKEEQNDGDGNDDKKKKKKKPSFAKKHRSACLVVGCVALSTVGAFGGTYLATSLTGANKTVLYQSVKSNGTGSSSNNATNMSVKDIANATMNSVVEIKTESVANGEFFQQYVSSGAGSGVILSSDGYIVTNNHVIEGANKISVHTKDGKSYTATLIGTDAATDLAVIKIDATGLTPAVLGTSADLAVGDSAIAIGNPLGELGGTVTTGIISALDREITIDNEKMHLLQTNAAINPGNSGGGLFNSAGELIGVVNAKSSGDNIEGLGFAIPIDIAKPIITNLMENGYVKNRGELGVTLSMGKPNNTNPFQNGQSTTGENIYIVDVTKGKAADVAGLEAGDQITKVDNKVVEDISDVKSAVSARKAGDKLSITILRDGETKTIEVTLKEAVPESVSKEKQGTY